MRPEVPGCAERLSAVGYAYFGLIPAILKQRSHGLLQYRMNQIGGYLHQGYQDKSALRKPRMRKNQVFPVHLDIPIQKNVQIENSRRVAKSPDPSARGFYFLAKREQVQGDELRSQLNNLIQEPWLI